MGKPTNHHVAMMAQAALDAAMDKAEELGFARMQGLYGIERAHDAVGKLIALSIVLGPSGLDRLGKEIEAEMAQDAVRQAEDILKGEM